jgi:hypothetical protein
MTAQLAARAEILKLARLLRLDPEQLEYLEDVPADDVRVLREQVTDVLFTDHSHALGRLAAASKLLPVRVVATIGEKAFGPVLSARIAGRLDPARAVEMADALPIEFLADVAAELDPRRASEVISRIPAARIGAVTAELVRRREYVTMGRFVGHLGDEALGAALGEMSDADILHVGFVLESKSTLEHLIELLPAQRLEALVDAAAADDLWPETLDLLSHLSDGRRAELAQTVSGRQDGVLEAIVATAVEYGMWGELLPLLPVLPDHAQQRVARAAAKLDPAQRDAVMQQARDAGLDAHLTLIAPG